jgi:RNA polymerase sigma-54 factor
MELGPVLEQQVAITPQMILANTLLHLSSSALEQTVAQELAENPALELIEVRRCPACGLPITDGRCPSCSRREPRAEVEKPVYADDGASSAYYRTTDDADDPVSRLTSSTTLSEHLLQQVRLSLPPHDLPIAVCVVENLDSHGFLACELDEVADLCGVDLARAEGVVSAIQQLDPVGVAARNGRECLLIQVEHLSREGIEHPLVETLIQDHWEALSRQSFAEIAQSLGTAVDEIEEALQFIRHNLNPYPAHADWADLHESPPEQEAAYPVPDVIISRRTDGEGYDVELPGAQLYQLCVSASYRDATRRLTGSSDRGTWEALYDRARLFIKSVEQRWQTLSHLACCLVDHQRDFLDRGDKHLRPLTRAQVADTMGVHESTVSRAVAEKYAQLPGGRIVPLAKFFDSAAPVKETIKELVAQESKPLSDREIAEELAQRGYSIARRTVAKYRNALNILPSSLR